jgi:hypothetical protein
MIFLMFISLIFPAAAWSQTASPVVAETSTTTLPDFESELDINLSSGFYRQYKDAAGTEHTESNVQITYLNNLRSPFQVGGSIGLQGSDSRNYLTVYATGVANLVPDYSNSFFLSTSLGAKTTDEADENTGEIKQRANFYGLITIGKRLNIRKHFSYKPFIYVSKSGNLAPEYGIQFLNFSVNW